MAVIVDRDLAWFENTVNFFHTIATPVLPRTTRVTDAGVTFDHYREVGLQVFCGYVFKQGPPRVPIDSVSERASGNTAVQDLHQLEQSAVAGDARV